MLEKLSKLIQWGSPDKVQSPDLGAAVDLPPQQPPKAPNKAVAFASYLTSTRASKNAMPVPDARLLQKDLNTLRNAGDSRQVVKGFAQASPDLAAAVFAYLRTAITDGYIAVANNPDGSFNVDATNLLQQIITRMDVMPNYANGFGGTHSLRSISESLGKEILYYGAASAELVLDKARTPSRIQPIHVPQIHFVPDGNDLIPEQWVSGAKVNLDVPTFFYVSLDQDLTTAYATSPLEPALRPTMFSEDFVQDLWRVVKRAVHPRQHVRINWEKLQTQIPADARHDANKMTEWMNSVVEDVTAKVNNLGVDEALVYFDFLQIERETNGNISLSSEWQTLHDIANAKLATGAKTLPAILGHGVGSSNVASTESMLFVKSAAGAVQAKLNELLSRAFTLAVRLYGLDVVVTFKYNTIDLRPDAELESFKALKQSRILELLSLGLVSDEEASLQLTGKLPPPGYVRRSGTLFTVVKPDANNPNNGTTNSGSTLNQNLNPKTPTGGARGSNTKASVIDFNPSRDAL